jgi:hypothetical protein
VTQAVEHLSSTTNPTKKKRITAAGKKKYLTYIFCITQIRCWVKYFQAENNKLTFCGMEIGVRREK